MAKSYVIPGVGHFSDGEGGKEYVVPGVGHFTEAAPVVGGFQAAWAQDSTKTQGIPGVSNA